MHVTELTSLNTDNVEEDDAEDIAPSSEGEHRTVTAVYCLLFLGMYRIFASYSLRCRIVLRIVYSYLDE